MRWLAEAEKHEMVVGSQARILYSDQIGRVKIAQAFNKAVASGQVQVILFLMRSRGSSSCFLKGAQTLVKKRYIYAPLFPVTEVHKRSFFVHHSLPFCSSSIFFAPHVSFLHLFCFRTTTKFSILFHLVILWTLLGSHRD